MLVSWGSLPLVLGWCCQELGYLGMPYARQEMRNPVCAEFLSALHIYGCFALTASSLWCADGSVLAARRLASDVTFNIMNAPVVGSPVMDELRRQAKEQCLDRRALLSYSSHDSNDDSNRSVQRKNTRAD